MIRKYKTINYWQSEPSEHSECKYWLAVRFYRIEFNANFTIFGKNSIREIKEQINYILTYSGESKNELSEMTNAYCMQKLKNIQ
jgi:hypothetical protein